MKALIFWQLLKPRLVVAYTMGVAAGYAYAIGGNSKDESIVTLIVGMSFALAAANVINNYIDRDTDKQMARTSHRPLANGLVSGKETLALGVILFAGSLIVLGLFVNYLIILLTLVGLGLYWGVYTYARRRFAYGSLAGALPAAIVPLTGYVGATGRLDEGAFGFFVATLVCFVAVYYIVLIGRRQDYIAAGLPVPAHSDSVSGRVLVVLFVLGVVISFAYLFGQ